MPSNALAIWRSTRRAALDEIAAAHAAIGGTARGRRYATQQINQAYAMLLSSQFQGFCRDLHTEAVDKLCPPVSSGDARILMLRVRLTIGRRLETGNPNPANIANDFGWFGFTFWDALDAHDARNAQRRRTLEELNVWRNAIAHQDFKVARLGGRTQLRLADVQRWRVTCDHLATEFDAVTGDHLAIIIGARPW